METATKSTKPHIGRKISRIRELRGMKQEALAYELGITQQAVSKIEQSETVEEETLGKVADALGVQPEAIKNFSEEAIIYNIQNNYEGSNKDAANVSVTNYQCSFNPLDKVLELYERMLKLEQEKTAMVEDLLKKFVGGQEG
ncbi:MAG: helix-turn-helix transcriptional regulator [Marinoscillum sp.]